MSDTQQTMSVCINVLKYEKIIRIKSVQPKHGQVTVIIDRFYSHALFFLGVTSSTIS